MSFVALRLFREFISAPNNTHPDFLRSAPERIVLPVCSGCKPNPKPPVRIFLGTEPAQYRAERVFIWSVMQVRDPGRVYEIYLMKSLAGFNQRFWLTGFTNYRFAVPYFAGGAGRAIYNDVDQIYLYDPSRLFDLDLNGHGYLAVAPNDTSVMVMDCARMLPFWTLSKAQQQHKNRLLADAYRTSGLWGYLNGEWNARDNEFVPGRSKLLHYTTLHWQPWQPFPEQFVYAHNPVSDPWFNLERQANAAHFDVFTAPWTSTAYRDLVKRLQQAPEIKEPRLTNEVPGLSAVLAEESIQTLLDCRIEALGKGSVSPVQEKICQVTNWDPVASSASTASMPALFDAVLCRETLEFLPDEDIPWFIDSLFNRARKLLYCLVRENPAGVALTDGPLHRRRRSFNWWRWHFETIGRRFPDIHWVLAIDHQKFSSRQWMLRTEGHRLHHRTPVVWVLAYSKPGHTSQAVGLAEALGWPYQIKRLNVSPLDLFLSQWTEKFYSNGKMSTPAGLKPPWPDIILAAGWLPTRVARWIAQQSDGRTRLILAGRKSGLVQGSTEIIVGCRHFRMPPHPRRIDTILPPHLITEEKLQGARTRWKHLMDKIPAPRVVLLVGGPCKQYTLSPTAAAQMVNEVLAQTHAIRGTLFVVTSRRTGAKITEAIRDAMGIRGYLHEWRREQCGDNPYLGYLALADILVVTGESESMIAEAIATGKPTYIYPLKPRRHGLGWWFAFCAWVGTRANRQPKNRRGTVRPQQGFEYLCSRVIQSGIILPPRDLEGLHRYLFEHGIALPCGHSPFAEAASPREPVDRDLGRQLRDMIEQC